MLCAPAGPTSLGQKLQSSGCGGKEFGIVLGQSNGGQLC